MVKRAWKLSPRPSCQSSPPVENDRFWLERYEHTPNKIQLFPAGMAVMASSNAITFHSAPVIDSKKALTIQSANQVIKMNQPVSCIAFGFCHHVSYGIRRLELLPIVASGHANGEIAIWHGETSQLITRLISHSGTITQVLISHASKSQTQIISVSLDRTAKLWDFEDNGYNMSQTVPLSCPLYCQAWSPDGKLVAFAGSSQKIYLHHKKVGGPIETPAVKNLCGHLHNIVSLKFMPDNAILISASWDGRLLMWDPYTGQMKQMISMHFPLPSYVFPSQITGIDISQFGHAIISLSDKGHVYLWNPLSMQLRMNDMECVLNTEPEDEVAIIDDGSYRSINFAMAENYVLIPSFSSAKANVFAVKVPAPPLKHLCRLAIRQIIPETMHLKRLNVPPRIISYLCYDTWV